MKRVIFFAALAAAMSAHGQVTTIGPFTGDQSEGWETQTAVFVSTIPCFGGGGNECRAIGGSALLITSGWSFFGQTNPHGGGKFMGGAGCNYGFYFAEPVSRFGGYFCTNADVGDAMATFYDAAGNPITTLAVSAPVNGEWTWNGWESTVPIGHVDIIANNQYGGFIDSDDLEATFATGGAVTINPTSTTLAPGIVISGTPADMFTSNDVYYVLRPGVVLSSSQSPIVLVLSGTAPGSTASSLNMVVESHANQANIRQTIDAYNFSTASYDQLNQSVLTTADVSNNLPIASPNNHIGPGNEVRSRLSYKAVGPILSYPWRVSIDEATWRYTP